MGAIARYRILLIVFPAAALALGSWLWLMGYGLWGWGDICKTSFGLVHKYPGIIGLGIATILVLAIAALALFSKRMKDLGNAMLMIMILTIPLIGSGTFASGYIFQESLKCLSSAKLHERIQEKITTDSLLDALGVETEDEEHES